MSILVLGIIGNSIIISELAFADKPDLDAKMEARDEAKEARDEAKEARDEAKEVAKQSRGDIEEFDEAVVSNSSASPTTDSDIERSGKETICHIPPGNPANAHTITVGAPAVTAHLAHGDVDESCETADLDRTEENEAEKESRATEDASQKESRALERALRLIEQLEQKMSNLEERLQNLLDKYESGEYYGNISSADAVTNSYVISFEGMATSIYDDTVTTEMSGELFMENQVTSSNTSKFKILSGEVIIGNNFYDVAFGKARTTSSGQGDSMVIILQTIDSKDNDNTIKLTLGFNPQLEGEFGIPSEEFEILENSKVSEQWVLDGSGQLSLGS